MQKRIKVTTILTIAICSLSFIKYSFALTYQSDVDLQYTFAPTLDVSLSTNTGFIIENLAPGNSAYSNTVTITASSNSADGFTLSATVGDSTDSNRNNNKLVHSNNTNYFESIATNANLALDSLGTNKWGYAVCTTITNNECSTWSNYNGLPAVGNTGAQLAEINSAGSTSVDMRIGASSTNTQVSGTFTNNVNFAMTAKVVTYNYTITYDANSSGSVSSMPSNVTNSQLNTGGTILLSNLVPTLSGDSFLGWCQGALSGTTCTGTLYQPGEHLKIPNASSSSTNAVTLLAVWGNGGVTPPGPSGDGCEGVTYCMQEVGTWGDDLDVGDEVEATDSRDGKTYTVARLADGNIWMTQNLDHDIVGTANFYTYENTDIGHGSTSNASATWTGTATYATGTTTWNGSYIAPESYDPGDVCWLGEGEYSYDGTCADTHYHLGNYYNWTAAVAMSNSSSYTSYGTDVDQSICPAGWMLPKGGSNTGSGSFYNLVSQYDWSNDSYMMEGSYSMWGSPLYFPLSGYWRGNLIGVGEGGGSWSSVVNDSKNACVPTFLGNGNVLPDQSTYRSDGISVRCVARSAA